MMRDRRFAGIFHFLAALLLVAVVLPGRVLAAETVSLLGTEEDGYGRLVFAWPDTGLPADPNVPDTRLPEYDALVSAGVLVITFDRPFAIDTEELLRRMPRYLALIRADADEKTIRLAMKADFKLHTREAGHELYIDLLPPTWTGTPAPLPDEVNARLTAEEEERQRLAAAFEEQGPQALEIVESVPTVTLRVGERPGFTRLAFDWDRPVLYSTAFLDNRITITFDQIADLALAPIRVDPPAFITSASSIKSGGRLTVFIETDPRVKVLDFREDLSVVLDVSPIRGAGGVPVAAAPPAPLLPAPDAGGEGGNEVAEAIQAGEAQIAAATPPSEPGDAAQAAPAAPAVDDADQSGLAETPPDAADGSGDPAMAEVQDGNPAPVAATMGANVNDDALPVYAEIVGRSVRLTFPWSAAVDAAIFQRDERVWMLFDRSTRFDLSNLGPTVLERLGEPQTISLDRASVLQFNPPSRVLVAASEKDDHWVVTLGDVIVEPTRPVNITRSWTNNGEPQVLFDLENAGRVHWIRDPVVQDTIAVVSAKGPPQGLLAPRSFVEFQALSTAQGLALVSRADDLYVSPSEDGITVSRGSGLTLSAADGPAYSGAGQGVSDPSAPGRMDFERWRYSPGDTFIERKQYHQLAVAQAQPSNMAEARIKFAKFLLSYRLGAEAYTQLQAALRETEGLDRDPGFKALIGVSRIMMARYEDAIGDLSLPGLADDPHSSLWLGVAHAELGDWVEARRAFEGAEQAFAFYAPDLQALFRVKAAEAALGTGDLGSVEFNLDRVPTETNEVRWMEQAELTRARYLEASGRIDEALEIYDTLISSAHGGIAARARFAHVTLRNQLGALSDDALLEELERLRLMWRGDDVELAVLERLGELRVARGEVAEGLTVWRIAVGAYPGNERGRRIASRMSETFIDLFLGGGADKLDPVEALTLYYNFRELTPIGRRGDALIRNLADRMVEVDLLDKAADLLRHQVENRLRGTARAQVATKLALIELMNHQPDRALQTIRSTKQVRLPAALAHKRHLLEARALADLTLYDHALDLLSEMDGEEGVAELVADIYWDSQQWDIAAARFEEALGERWRDPLELEAAERFQVMRAAISYSLADDAVGLERIRSKFGELMRASPDAAGFAVVTDPIETHGVAFRDLARSIAATGTLDNFIESIRSSFPDSLDDPETAIN